MNMLEVGNSSVLAYLRQTFGAVLPRNQKLLLNLKKRMLPIPGCIRTDFSAF